MYQLLGVNTDAKTPKGTALGYLTGILYLAPGNLSGFEVCAWRNAGCTAACLSTSGRGKFANVQLARIRKTRWFFSDRNAFMGALNYDIKQLVLDAERASLKPCARLNGTSDVAWELGQRSVIKAHPTMQFYDYTKSVHRAVKSLTSELWPSNYHLTFSYSGENLDDCLKVLGLGGNVAVVFDGERPKVWNGFQVIDGDLHDLRFIDPRGTVVGLKPKGEAKKDTTGFVVRSQIKQMVAA
jgi:hypothetical protein